MAELSTCLSPACGHQVEGDLKKCPQCGWAMRGPRNIRIRGWVLVVLGLFLTLFMGAIAWNLLPTLLAPGKEVDGTSFTGTDEDAEFALFIFGLVIMAGILFTANGVYMVAKGRQSRPFALAAIGVVAILFAIAWAIRRKLIF